MSRILCRSTAIAGLLLLAAAGARAQTAPAAEAGETWHIVRPGETLEQIATRYLGSIQLWQVLHRLNPGIANPNQIEPGQRIRIPAVRPVRLDATLNRLSRQVEEQPSPIPWKAAQLGDVLVERDGVRTYGKSSAELRFSDGARLTVTEDSLVFLRRSAAVLQGVERKSIEIVDGQADLEARAATPSGTAPDVEIVIGKTRATAKADRSGPSQTRARKAEGGAKLMIYGGDSEVEAGGAKVRVPRGMGTSVAATGPPSPPEPLLPAPALTTPEAGAERACADPTFSWAAVPEAESYIVEVCRDPGCGALVERQTGVPGPTWRPAAPLPLSGLYWRVTARGRSGLDGYPSAALALSVTSARTGLPSPTGSLAVAGPQMRVGDRLFTAASSTVEVTAVDADGGKARWVPVIGGEEASALPATWAAGEHTVGALALDGCGNRGVVSPLAFVTDTEAPAIRWEVGDRESLADRLAPDSEGERRRLRNRRSGGVPADDAWQSRAGVWRLPLPWVKDREPGRVQFPVDIRSDRPQAFLAAVDTTVSADGRDDALDEHILWIAADDGGGAGVDRMVVKSREESGRVVLEVEATDLVGNSRKKEIVLRKRG
jgi:LysM repeat protein